MQPAARFEIPVNEALKDAQRIHEFRGEGDYALTSFLREVDTLLQLLDTNPAAKQYAYQRIIINKIQGPALDVIRTLGPEATWIDIKKVLISNFGIQETYYQLHQKALSLRNFQVNWIFKTFLLIWILASTQAHLVIEKFETNIGYSEIKLEEVDIVKNYDTILHIINPVEILGILDKLESNIKQSDLDDKIITFDYQIKTIRNKIHTLIPHKQKRGLLNF